MNYGEGFLNRIRYYIDSESINNIIGAFLKSYSEIDDRIGNYTLRKDIIRSIIKEAKSKKYSAQQTINESEEVLNKLGFSDLITELRECLDTELSKNELGEVEEESEENIQIELSNLEDMELLRKSFKLFRKSRYRY